MAYTQDQLTAIQAARATGALEVVSSNGERVRYRSLAEMDRIIGTMTAALQASTVMRPKVGYAVYTRD